MPEGWEWAEPSSCLHCSPVPSSHKPAEEEKGPSVPETSALMAQTWWCPLDRALRLKDAAFLHSDKLEVFYIGNKDTEKFLAGHLLFNLPPFSHCYLIKILIIFILYSYQDFVRYRTALSRKPSKAKSTNGKIQRILRAFSFPTPGLELFSKSDLKHGQLKTWPWGCCDKSVSYWCTITVFTKDSVITQCQFMVSLHTLVTSSFSHGDIQVEQQKIAWLCAIPCLFFVCLFCFSPVLQLWPKNSPSSSLTLVEWIWSNESSREVQNSNEFFQMVVLDTYDSWPIFYYK